LAPRSSWLTCLASIGPNTAASFAFTAAVIAASSLGLPVWLHPLKIAQVAITITSVMIGLIAIIHSIAI
jgi:hypothetical protein